MLRRFAILLLALVCACFPQNPNTSSSSEPSTPVLGALSFTGGHYVRGVVDANVASLSAFTVAGNDGLTYVEGDTAILVLQTTKTQNGPWRVGVVTTGTAPLTRPTDWPASAQMPAGSVFEVNAGTKWASSEWKVSTAGSVVVNTTSIDIYPRISTGNSTLNGASPSTGHVTTGLWVLARGDGLYSISLAPPTAITVGETSIATGLPATGDVNLVGPNAATDVVHVAVYNW